jgi:hypothetical protein
VQGKEKMSRDYIELFTRKAIEVKGAYDKSKCLIFEKGLRTDTSQANYSIFQVNPQ